jgi:hypothetical protein
LSLAQSPPLRVAAAAALAVALAYQAGVPVSLPMDGLPAARLARDLHDAEGGYRWTRERSVVRLPGPGPGRDVRVEATVSAWRPRGRPLPEVALEAGGTRARARTTPRLQVVTLETRSVGAWTSDLELVVTSDVVQPSPSDPRRLGVRLHAVRIVPGARFTPGLPPLRPLLLSVVACAAVYGGARRLRAGTRAARRAGVAAALVLGLGHVLARAHAAVLLPALTAVAVAAWLAAPRIGRAARAVAVVAGDAARRAARAAAALAGAPGAAVVAVAAGGVTLAFLARPVVDLDVGTGREEPFASGLLAYDGGAGGRFRHAADGAVLDLRDLGGGGRWQVDVRAAAPAPLQVRLGDATAGAAAPDASGWHRVTVQARAPWGWRAGLPLALMDGGGALALDHVRIDRGRAWPPLRVLAALSAAALLVALAFGTAGFGSLGMGAAGAAVGLAAAAAVWVDPILSVPFAGRFVVVSAAGLALCALTSALDARRAPVPDAPLPPAAVAAAGVGFIAWLSAALTPLYRGGHFVFHSSIAEEIWQGRFLHYFLPYPGSMLSQQAQWGNVVVPHPCLFHVAVAPLAALPRPWFYVGVKAALALWLAGMALVAALLAGRLAGPRAAALAAVAFVATPATFQLVGLGHLMTIFGCWAMALAMALVALRFERLGERRTWWAAVVLLTLCFLSYTAALLFTGIALAAALPWLLRRHGAAARALVTATAGAALFAFVLYYAFWTWPFLSETVPRLLGGSGRPAEAAAGGALLARAWALPRKLGYTFGTALVPLAGLIGLGLAAASRRPAAVLAAAWGAILVVFSALDLSFNFLLKHHYFTMVPVAVGVGALMARVADRPPGRAAVAVALAVMAAMALGVGFDVATGRIP